MEEKLITTCLDCFKHRDMLLLRLRENTQVLDQLTSHGRNDWFHWSNRFTCYKKIRKH